MMLNKKNLKQLIKPNIFCSCLPKYLYQLKTNEYVQLKNGDQFYFVATKCLLTVVIKQHDATSFQQRSPHVLPSQIATTIEWSKEYFAQATTTYEGLRRCRHYFASCVLSYGPMKQYLHLILTCLCLLHYCKLFYLGLKVYTCSANMDGCSN